MPDILDKEKLIENVNNKVGGFLGERLGRADFGEFLENVGDSSKFNPVISAVVGLSSSSAVENYNNRQLQRQLKERYLGKGSGEEERSANGNRLFFGLEVDENNNILEGELKGLKVKQNEYELVFEKDGTEVGTVPLKREVKYRISDWTRGEQERIRKTDARFSGLSDEEWELEKNRERRYNRVLENKLANMVKNITSPLSQQQKQEIMDKGKMGGLEYLDMAMQLDKMKDSLTNIATKIRTRQPLTDSENQTLLDYSWLISNIQLRGVGTANRMFSGLLLDLSSNVRATIESFLPHLISDALIPVGGGAISGVAKFVGKVGLNTAGSYAVSLVTDKIPFLNRLGVGSLEDARNEKYRDKVLNWTDKGEMFLNRDFSQKQEDFFNKQAKVERVAEQFSEEVLDAPMELLGKVLDNCILGKNLEKLVSPGWLQKLYGGVKKFNSIPNSMGTTFDGILTEHLEELVGMSVKYALGANDPDTTLHQEMLDYGKNFLPSTFNIIVAGGLFRASMNAVKGHSDNFKENSKSIAENILRRYLEKRGDFSKEEIDRKMDLIGESAKDKLANKVLDVEEEKSREKYENKLKEIEGKLTEEWGEEKAKNQMAVLDVMVGSLARELGVSRYEIIEGYRQEFGEDEGEFNKNLEGELKQLYKTMYIKGLNVGGYNALHFNNGGQQKSNDPSQTTTNNYKTLSQNVKGSFNFDNNYKEFVIKLFRDKADQSTLLHENMHFFEKTIEKYALLGYERAKFLYNEIKGAVGEVQDKMTVEKSEDLARGYEQYIREGKYKNEILKDVYDFFRKHLLKIYERAEDLNIDVNNPQMNEFFDKYIFNPTKYVNDSDWCYKLKSGGEKKEEGEDLKQELGDEGPYSKFLNETVEKVLKQGAEEEDLRKAIEEYGERLRKENKTREELKKRQEYMKLYKGYLSGKEVKSNDNALRSLARENAEKRLKEINKEVEKQEGKEKERILKEENEKIREFNKEVEEQGEDENLKKKEFKNYEELARFFEEKTGEEKKENIIEIKGDFKHEKSASKISEGGLFDPGKSGKPTGVSINNNNIKVNENFKNDYRAKLVDKEIEVLEKLENKEREYLTEKQQQQENNKIPSEKKLDELKEKLKEMKKLQKIEDNDYKNYKDLERQLGDFSDLELRNKLLRFYKQGRGNEYVKNKINEYKQKQLKADFQENIDDLLSSTIYINRRTGKEYGNVIYEDSGLFNKLKEINNYSGKRANQELEKLIKERKEGKNFDPQLDYDLKKELLYFKSDKAITVDSMERIIKHLGEVVEKSREVLRELKRKNLGETLEERREVMGLINSTVRQSNYTRAIVEHRGNWKSLMELLGGKKLADKMDFLENELLMANGVKQKQDKIFNALNEITGGEKETEEYLKKLNRWLTTVEYSSTASNMSDKTNIVELSVDLERYKQKIIRELEKLNANKQIEAVENVRVKAEKSKSGRKYKYNINDNDVFALRDALDYISYLDPDNSNVEQLRNAFGRVFEKKYNSNFTPYELNGWNLMYYSLMKRNKATDNLLKRYYSEESIKQLDELLEKQDDKFRKIEQLLFDSVQDREELAPIYILEFQKDMGQVKNYFPRRSKSENEINIFETLMANNDNDREKTISAIENRRPDAIPDLGQNPLTLALNHINQTEYVKNMAGKLKNIMNIFNSDLRQMIKNKYGKYPLDALDTFLTAFKQINTKQKTNAVEEFVKSIHSSWAKSVTNTPSVFLKQAGSHILYADGLKAKDLPKFYKNFLYALFHKGKIKEQMMELSPYLKKRFEDKDRNYLKDLIREGDEDEKNKGWFEKTSEKLDRNRDKKLFGKGFSFTDWGDEVSVVCGGYARYKTELENGKSPREARDVFERMTVETQQETSMASLQSATTLRNKQSTAGRMIEMFLNQDIQNINKQLQRNMEYNNGEITGEEKLERILVANVLNSLAQAIVGGIIDGMLGRGLDMERTFYDFLTSLTMSFFMPSIIFGQTQVGLRKILKIQDLGGKLFKGEGKTDLLTLLTSIYSGMPIEYFYRFIFKRMGEDKKQKRKDKDSGEKIKEELGNMYLNKIL